jgi:hypothetical protein
LLLLPLLLAVRGRGQGKHDGGKGKMRLQERRAPG